jgi:transposase
MLDKQIAGLDVEIARRSREDEVTRRPMTIPGVGPITASATAAPTPRIETFRKGRDFALRLGLTPFPRLDQPRVVPARAMRPRPACRGEIE